MHTRCGSLLLALCASWAWCDKHGGDGVTVQLEEGGVRGRVRHDENGAPYVSFRGIPYAEQPIGDLRFEPPKPAPKWRGTRDAAWEGAVCPQHDVLYRELMVPREFNEACLYVNVHTPVDAVAQGRTLLGLPVLVFIHGGGFNFGSGDSDIHGPEYLVPALGIIVVTFNYRLGALGFLTLDHPSLPGNLGLRDQVEALRWVRRNIAAFGGNPDSITVGGQSAGGASVHLLAISSMTRGLFSKAIMISGTGARSFFSSSPGTNIIFAHEMLRKLNISTDNPEQVVRQLKNIPIQKIMDAQRELQDVAPFGAFSPVVESRHPGVVPFLEEDPKEAGVADIPMLIGHTDQEGHSFVRRLREVNFTDRLRAVESLMVPPSLQTVTPTERNAERIRAIKRRYFTYPDLDNEDERLLQQYLDYIGDAYFIYPAVKLAEQCSRRNRSPVYLYEFAYEGRYSPIKSVSALELFHGAGHIEDMTYLLRTNSFAGKISEHDAWVKSWMTVTVSNFVKTGNPTPEGYGNELGEWLPYDHRTSNELLINSTVTMRRRNPDGLLQFFDEIHQPSREYHQPSVGNGTGGDVETEADVGNDADTPRSQELSFQELNHKD